MRRIALARRFGIGVVDQILSSLTNFAVTFVVARSAGTRGLGAFGLAFAAYTIVLGISRAINTEPMVVRHSTTSKSEWRAATAAATGSALTVGVLAGFGSLIASLVFHGTAADVFLVLAFGFPFLLLQDSWRFAFVAAARPGLAALNDLLWALTMLPVVTVLLVSDRATTTNVTFVWVTGAAVAAVGGIVQSRVQPRPQRLWAWWRENRDLGPRYVIEFLLSSVGVELVFFATGALSGLVAVGALRAGWLLIAPLNVLFMGLMLVAVPEGARLLQTSFSHLQRGCIGLSVALTLCVVAWATVLLLLPDDAGRELLGENWKAGQAVILPIALYTVGSTVINGALIGLRALQAARRSLAARVVTGPLVLIAGVTGALTSDARGAAWGMAAGNAVAAVFWWRQFGWAKDEYCSGRLPARADGLPYGAQV